MNSNYNKYPKIQINDKEQELDQGWENIFSRLNQEIEKADKSGMTVAIETYQGINFLEVKRALEKYLKPHAFFHSQEAFKEENEIIEMVFPFVTDDRIFGYMSDLEMKDFLNPLKTEELRRQIKNDSAELKIVYGYGASLCFQADLMVYLDMARREIQLRMRNNELGNMGVSNNSIDVARRYKQSFFVDWRVLDRHKMAIFDDTDFFIDANNQDIPKMISSTALSHALKKVNKQPFRVVPFFDPGPWGGQWMKEVMDLDRTKVNFGWSFDCVPEENSLLLGFGKQVYETPATNLILREPTELLGEHIYERFGAEFPIRFNFLDTMDGGNLSLQVHPNKEYIKEQFGMAYTQDESYYIMDASENAEVYLGLRNDAQPERLMQDLRDAQENSTNFDADKYVGKYAVKKHDHILIPAGTIHCSAVNNVVLEISATPYNFTFKLWDWGRLGLDNIPRPIHIEHGEKVIDWSIREEFSKTELINKIEKVAEGEGWIEERTGLYHTVFIETRRHWFTATVPHDTNGGVNVLNLVEGDEAIVESPTGAFEPFVVHYAETFIVPASVGKYNIRPHGTSKGIKCATVKAFVRK